MLFKDFFQFFYALTINYTNPRMSHITLADQVPDEQWAACRLIIPQDTEMAFISLFQLNLKFMDPDEDPEEFAKIRRTFRKDDDMTLASKAINNALMKNLVKDIEEEQNADETCFHDKNAGICEHA